MVFEFFDVVENLLLICQNHFRENKVYTFVAGTFFDLKKRRF